LLLAPRVRPTCISAPAIKHQHNESHVRKLLKKSAFVLRRHDPPLRCDDPDMCKSTKAKKKKRKEKEKKKTPDMLP
jgi:hypothetical protein